MKNKDDLTIVKLVAENFKRLEAIEITPDGHVIDIVGKNNQGKSSVLDAIYAAAGGSRAHPIKPIRDGEKSAFIDLDLGRISINRTFRRMPVTGVVTTALTVKGERGSKFPSPQRMLDELVGSLSFNPLAFSRMSPKEQYEEIKKLCGLHFEEPIVRNEIDYAERTIQNRLAKQANVRADAIVVGEVTEPKDVEGLKKTLAEVVGKNEKTKEAMAEKGDLEKDIDAYLNRTTAETEAIEYYDKQIQSLQERKKEAEAKKTHSEDHLKWLNQKMKDDYDGKDFCLQPVQPIRDDIYQAEAFNRMVETNIEAQKNKDSVIEEVNKAEAEAERLTAAMQKRKDSMNKQIENAEMPIPGLSIDDGIVIFEGIPLEQCSGSDIVRISCAIAMSQNPELRVLLVDDANGFDTEHLQIFKDMAKDKNYQVWMTRVDESGEVGIEIRDGRIYEREEKEESAAEEA